MVRLAIRLTGSERFIPQTDERLIVQMEERDIVLEDLCEIVEDKKSHPRPVSDVDDETKRFGSRGISSRRICLIPSFPIMRSSIATSDTRVTCKIRDSSPSSSETEPRMPNPEAAVSSIHFAISRFFNRTDQQRPLLVFF